MLLTDVVIIIFTRLDGLGIETGIDMDKLVEAGRCFLCSFIVPIAQRNTTSLDPAVAPCAVYCKPVFSLDEILPVHTNSARTSRLTRVYRCVLPARSLY